MSKESKVLSLEEFKYNSPKMSGNQDGKIYTLDGYKYLVKKIDFRSTISELVGSRAAKLIAGDSVPEVYLVKDRNNEIYVASKYIEGFTTLKSYKYSSKLPYKCLPSGCVIKKNGDIENINTYLLNILNIEYKEIIEFPNFEEVEIAIDFVKHADDHETNRGIIISGKKKLSAIVDFGWSIKNPTLHEDSAFRLDYNHGRMVLALNKLISITSEKLDEILNNSFSELKVCYPQQITELEVLQKETKSLLSESQEYLVSHRERIYDEKNILELIIARQNNNLEKCNQLLSIIDPNLKNINDNYKILLLEHSPEDANNLKVTLQNPEEELMNAAKNNNPELFKILLSNVTDQEYLGRALKISASIKNSKDIIEMLLPKIIEQEHLTSTLLESVRSKNIEIFKVLLPHLNNETLNNSYRDTITEFKKAYNIQEDKISITETIRDSFSQINDVMKPYNSAQTPVEVETVSAIAQLHPEEEYQKIIGEVSD